MKNKYQRLSKEEKKKARLDYKNANKENYNRLIRLTVLGYVGIFYSLVVIALDYFILDGKIWDLILNLVLFFVSCIFIFKSKDLLKHNINNYLINKNKK